MKMVRELKLFEYALHENYRFKRFKYQNIEIINIAK